MATPWAPLALGALSLFGSNAAADRQKEASKYQNKISREQLELFRQAAAQYPNVLAWLAQNAGLPFQPWQQVGAAPGSSAGRPGFASAAPVSRQANGGGAAAPPSGLPQGLGGVPDQALGIYGQNPADLFRLRQAEDDIEQQNQGLQQRLGFLLGRQGAGAATTGAALAGAEQERMNRIEQFRRALAINAGQEQQQRVGALLSALGAGMGQGVPAANSFGNQAALAAGQGQAANSALGSALNAYLVTQALRRAQGPGNGEQSPVIGPYTSDSTVELMRRLGWM